MAFARSVKREEKASARRAINEELLDKVAGGNDDDKGGYPCTKTCLYCSQPIYCEKAQDMDKHMVNDCTQNPIKLYYAQH